jgi:CheY-like chemotaxis protein
LLKKEKNIDLYHALNGKEGIARCLSKNVKVVFIDMNMPGLNGAKTLHILKKLTKERGIVCPQAVLLTAHDLEKSVVVDSMGFNDYIQKPINKKKIMSVLDELSKAERKVA